MSSTHDPHPTAVERAATQELLADSRDELVAFCRALRPQDWTASDGPGRWTIAGVLEHLALIEARIGRVLETTLASPAAADWHEQTAVQDARLSGAATPQGGIEAPPALYPTGAPAPEETLRAFQRSREATIALAARADVPFKQHLRNHPVFGVLNAWQWVVITGHHTRRHLVQMQRIVAAKRAAASP